MRRLSVLLSVVFIFMFGIFFAVGGFSSFKSNLVYVSSEMQSAAVFFVQSITIAKINSDYNDTPKASSFGTSANTVFASAQKKVRILIVPGHQPNYGGAVFNGVYERNIVVDIADDLARLLEQNPHYKVMVARTKTQWNPVLESYFNTHKASIEAFRLAQIENMNKHLRNRSVLSSLHQVGHDSTPALATLQLYGIHKWASVNGYDIVLHMHVNDERGHRLHTPGKDTGFAVYVPDHQYSNAIATRAVGAAIAARLNAYHATSTLPNESPGVVEDQQLIAIGSNNSSDAAALLIEYGYIYEPQFQHASLLKTAEKDYAYQTYLGLQDFFKDPVQPTYGSLSFPYKWSSVKGVVGERSPGVYALQSELHYLGFYPPAGRNFSDCPTSGFVGTCTRKSIEEYQRAHNFSPIGILGPKTRAVLRTDLRRFGKS